MITLIWAQTVNGVIGNDNKIPWNIKEEINFFKQQTLNKTVVMGRETWQSLKIQPLPNRKNIVVSRNKSLKLPNDVQLIVDFDKYLQDVKDLKEEIMIIGGSYIYNDAIKFANKLLVSIINYDFKGDRFAPNIDLNIFKLENVENYNEFKVYKYLRIKNDK